MFRPQNHGRWDIFTMIPFLLEPVQILPTPGKFPSNLEYSRVPSLGVGCELGTGGSVVNVINS